MPHPFYDPFVTYFAADLETYGFQVTSRQYDAEGFGSGTVRLESRPEAGRAPEAGRTPEAGQIFLEFQVEGMGPELKIYAGKRGQQAIDLAWIFAYLTQPVNPSPSGAAARLYYFPHPTLRIWGEASIRWQMERLADILQCMWPAILAFLDIDGPRSADFLAFQERAKRAASERDADGYWLPAGQLEARAVFDFAAQAERSFAFLRAYGFKITRSDPVLVRFESTVAPGYPSTYVNIFHRVRSYHLGVHTGHVRSVSSFEANFDLEELAAWAGVPYKPFAASTAAGMRPALNRLARLFRRCAPPILASDQRLFEALIARRVDAARRASRAWSERNRR